MINISYFCIVKRNNIHFYIYLITVLMFFTLPASSQSFDSEKLSEADSAKYASMEISLLTCQPHDEVYSLYGHTAIRVTDKNQGIDIAVNWGVFDPSKPYFVLRFVFGLTDYMMGVLPTNLFLEEYRYYGCGVYQQKLNLTLKEKKALMTTLQENYLPENREYRYNFIFDNCTSRARDVIVESMEGKVAYQPTEMQRGERSFRQLIHWKNHDYPWAAFGNDILLGVQADRNTEISERQFLPEILMADFDSAVVTKENGERKMLVDSAYWVLKPSSNPLMAMEGFPLSPFACALIILFVIIAITDYEHFVLHKHCYVIDRMMFFIFGLLGIVLTAMIFSQHPTVRINLQILLFCPLFLVLAFAPKQWKNGYNVALVLLILFFLGNIFQSYAEGMNLLAFSLLKRIVMSGRISPIKKIIKK